MIIAALGFFSLVAILGATLFTLVMRNKPRPRMLMVMHGTFAATSVLLLIIHSVRSEAFLNLQYQQDGKPDWLG